jgi:cytochrome c oxidase subunit 4
MSARGQEARRIWLMPALIWLALVVLLAITVGSAFVPLGAGNTIINMAIAAAKAALIGLFFMNLVRSSTLLRLGAVAGLFWLAFLFVLTSSDYLTRLN